MQQRQSGWALSLTIVAIVLLGMVVSPISSAMNRDGTLATPIVTPEILESPPLSPSRTETASIVIHGTEGSADSPTLAPIEPAEVPAGAYVTNNGIVVGQPAPAQSGCLFSVQFWNFGAGALTASVLIQAIPDAGGTTRTLSDPAIVIGEDDAGGASDLDAGRVYDIAPLLRQQPPAGPAGYFVRLTVTAPFGSGGDVRIDEYRITDCLGSAPTPTNTPESPTATPVDTPTNTPEPPTAIPVDTPTNTPESPTATPVDTPTNTPEPPTSTPVDTPTNTPESPTSTPVDNPTITPEQPTATPVDTPTNTPESPTATPADTPTSTPEQPTSTPVDTPTNTPEPPTATPVDTPTNTPEPPTSTPVDTPTNTPESPTATPADTPTSTLEPPTATATNTPIPSTPTPTVTPEAPTATPTDVGEPVPYTPTFPATPVFTPVTVPTITPPVPSATQGPALPGEPLGTANLREAPIVPSSDPTTSDGARAGQLAAILTEGAVPETVAARYGMTVLDFVDAINLALFGVPATVNLDALRALLANDPAIGIIEANSIIGAPEGHRRSEVQFSQPHDVLVADPDYGYELVGSFSTRCVTGSGVIVAVLDTGIDLDHPEFSGRLLPGWNVIEGTDNVAERPDGVDNDGDGSIDEMFGHGTHVAGIVARVAPGAMILPVKVLNDDGIGDSFGLAQGLMFAASAGADVINLSLSSLTDSQIVRVAVDAVRADGVVVVAATGNSGHEEPKEYPAAIEGVIAVAATGPDDLKSSFSNYGDEIRMSAPGTDIESALPGGEYGIASGTSMAAPFIAAAVALTIERYPGMTPDQVAERIQAAAIELDPLNPEYAGQLGAGRLDLITTLSCGS